MLLFVLPLLYPRLLTFVQGIQDEWPFLHSSVALPAPLREVGRANRDPAPLVKTRF